MPALQELATNLAGQSNDSAALLRAIYAAHASCAPVRAELQKRLQTGRRLLAQIFDLARKRGEVRRDRSSAELARLTQIILLGVSFAWALNPDSSLRGTAEDIWDLFLSNLRADEKHRSITTSRRRSRT